MRIAERQQLNLMKRREYSTLRTDVIMRGLRGFSFACTESFSRTMLAFHQTADSVSRRVAWQRDNVALGLSRKLKNRFRKYGLEIGLIIRKVLPFPYKQQS